MLPEPPGAGSIIIDWQQKIPFFVIPNFPAKSLTS
jgi:hypothetical protein